MQKTPTKVGLILSLLFFQLLLFSCAHGGEEVTTKDQFIVSGMENIHHTPMIIGKPELPSATNIRQHVIVPKGYERLDFVIPTGEIIHLMVSTRSKAVGSPNNGKLINPFCIKDHGPHYIHFGPNSCGTDLAVTILMFAIGQLYRVYPDTPPVVIGSLSAPSGGPIRPHKSHQNGLDVDIGYIPVKDMGLKAFKRLAPSQIDFDKTFFLMATMMATGKVKYIFVDYDLESYLYDAARAMGYDQDQLKIIFQYPRTRYTKAGIIRYSPGHKDHFHVRFVCPDNSPECVD